MSPTSWLTLLVTVLLARLAAAQPVEVAQIRAAKSPSPCTSLAKRVNWLSLSAAQKKSYISAVKCLKTKPSKTGFEVSKNLYDDFASIHIQQDHNIHGVAAFLPWHRRFVQARERALRTCGYTGPTPYWDWTKAADQGAPQSDPIFSVTDGFGGNGDADHQQAVTRGPFANFTLDIVAAERTPTPVYSRHLLRRNFEDNPFLYNNFNSSAVAKGQKMDNFQDYRYYLEGVPHGAVHQYIAGDMAPSSSPNEPLFFLHHAAIDRLWTLWQEQDRSKRLTDYKGNLPGGSSKDGPFDAKIDDVLPSFGGLIDQVRVRDVMDTRAGDLCYEVSPSKAK